MPRTKKNFSAEKNLMSIRGDLYEGRLHEWRLRFDQNRSFKEFRFFLAA